MRGTWMCALAEIQYTASHSADIAVNTDICDASIVSATHIPILRRMRLKQGTLYMVFNLLHYYPIKMYTFDKIRIYINVLSGKEASLLQESLRVTLHFRQS